MDPLNEERSAQLVLSAEEATALTLLFDTTGLRYFEKESWHTLSNAAGSGSKAKLWLPAEKCLLYLEFLTNYAERQRANKQIIDRHSLIRVANELRNGMISIASTVHRNTFAALASCPSIPENPQ